VFDDLVSKAEMNILIKISVREEEEGILNEIKRDTTMHEVMLEPDIYCVGFITFLRSDSPKKLDRIVLKCIWTFVLQMLLLGLLIYGFAVEKTPTGMVYKGLLKDIVVGDPSVNMSRIVCALLLHITLVPEIMSAKQMLSFAKKNPARFSG
jgi:hypothetical protein